MKAALVILLLCIVTVPAWSGLAAAQPAPAPPKVHLPNGETVWDLSGEWEALIENYGPWQRFGTSRNVYGIEQDGQVVTAYRLKEGPPPGLEVVESPSLQGELAQNGFKHVEILYARANVSPSTGRISADGKKIVIDNGRYVRVTLTRP